jgi:hypothetical protein
MSSRVPDLTAEESVYNQNVGSYLVSPFPNPMLCVSQCNFSSFFRFVIQIKYMNNLMANICLLRFSIDDHLEIP